MSLKKIIIFFFTVFYNNQSMCLKKAELNQVIKEIWEARANEWNVFIEDRYEKDINRFYQSDPVLWRFLKDVRSFTILDVGCGEGYLSRQLSRNGANVIAIDASPTLIKIAQQKAYNESLVIDYRVDDCSCMATIPSGFVDRLICNYVLMDIPDLEATITEFYRVLKVGAEAVIIFLHPCFPMESIQKTPELFIYGWKQPYFQEHVMKLPQWEPFHDRFTIFHRPLSTYWKAFKQAGFEVVDFEEPFLTKDSQEKLDSELVKTFSFMPHAVAFLLRKT